MAQWVRGLFQTRGAPAVTQARAALAAPPSAPPPPPAPAPSLWERVCFWRAEFQRQAREAPSVDVINARDAEMQEARARAGMEQIARAIAKSGAWLPGDRD